MIIPRLNMHLYLGSVCDDTASSADYIIFNIQQNNISSLRLSSVITNYYNNVTLEWQPLWL